eukprot:symbB.v1.2.027898.t1/scaffold2895.1/size67727/10
MKVLSSLAAISVWLHLPSTWAEAAFECESDECSLTLLQTEATKVKSTKASDSSEQVPMIAYPKQYCQHCGEMAFCHRASNPGCGGRATGGVASFNNHVKANGCRSNPTLTVPRSYMRDIGTLHHYAGGRSVLRDMLVSGFDHQRRNGDHGPLWQCIHAPKHISVRWLHLHTFCKAGKVDNLPSRHDYCAVMNNRIDAEQIASAWAR